jgi:hypothetical protein
MLLITINEIRLIFPKKSTIIWVNSISKKKKKKLYGSMLIFILYDPIFYDNDSWHTI